MSEIKNYLQQFHAENYLQREPMWLYDLRRDAVSSFSRLGFPTQEQEDWKYTSLDAITALPFRLAESLPRKKEIEKLNLGEETHELVFLDGHFSPELSKIGELPPDVRLGSLQSFLKEEPHFLRLYLGQLVDYEKSGLIALNTAFMQDGAVLHLPAGAVLTKPVHLLFISSSEREENLCAFPRNILLAGPQSKASVIESYFCAGKPQYFTNAVTEIIVGAGASLEHYKVCLESKSACHLATMQIQQAKDSHFVSHSISLGGALVRNDLNLIFRGQGGHCDLNGLYLVEGKEHVDNHTTIDHALPYCTSDEFYKGILDDKARGVFNGKIYVRKDAQKTNAYQQNKNLLLSRGARIDTKPQLEIFADDVRCTHGATVGNLDSQALFYLQSRGLPKKEAQSLLLYAFAKDVLARFKIDGVRTYLENLLFQRLAEKRMSA